jgi:single stranded DNA-binding protein (ssb)
MNNVSLIGRLGADVSLLKSKNGVSYCTLKLAVKDGEHTSWIKCTAFKATAEFLLKHCQKGMRIGITGKLKQDSYKKEDKVYSDTHVIISSIHFADGKKTGDEEPINDSNEFKEVESNENPLPWDIGDIVEDKKNQDEK